MRIGPTLVFLLAVHEIIQPVSAADPKSRNASAWKVGSPIVTYWAGPPLTDAVARQMAEGGWNLVWCKEKELDVAHRHGLRAMLREGLVSHAKLDDPTQREKLDALIDRVRNHPALHSYFVTDEPSADEFAGLEKMVTYLREHDPEHMAYINLYPMYASNKKLGTEGDTVTAYREHLRQYTQIVKPSLVSYDYYQFAKGRDTDDYFLNLAMIRRAALEARVPFLNIVQACKWKPTVRVPNAFEMRYLVYTTLAYGAHGISYYVYYAPHHTGGIALSDGTPTPTYHVLKALNREFVAIAEELQPLQSLGVYHAGMMPPGAEPLPTDALFRFDPALPRVAFRPSERVRGVLLGYFGKTSKPSHVVVVNLDYKTETALALLGPRDLETFDTSAGIWSSTGSLRIKLQLPPGGGKLVRVNPNDGRFAPNAN